MNYIKEQNRFDSWLETNDLPNLSMCMWYRLFAVFNKTKWEEWVSIDNARLMKLIKCKSEKTAIEAREKLIEAGLLQFEQGHKGSPSRYRLVPMEDVAAGGQTAQGSSFTVKNTVKEKIPCNFYSEKNTVNALETPETLENTVKNTVNKIPCNIYSELETPETPETTETPETLENTVKNTVKISACQEQVNKALENTVKNTAIYKLSNGKQYREEEGEDIRAHAHARESADDGEIDPLSDVAMKTPEDAAVRRVLLEFMPCGLPEPNQYIASDIEDMVILPEYGLTPDLRADLIIRAMKAVGEGTRERKSWGNVKGMIRRWQKYGERGADGAITKRDELERARRYGMEGDLV